MILCYYYEGEIESTEQANNQWGLLLSLVLVLLLRRWEYGLFFHGRHRKKTRRIGQEARARPVGEKEIGHAG